MAKQRQVRIEQKSALAAMQRLETRSDDELEAETKYKAAALAILGHVIGGNAALRKMSATPTDPRTERPETPVVMTKVTVSRG